MFQSSTIIGNTESKYCITIVIIMILTVIIKMKALPLSHRPSIQMYNTVSHTQWYRCPFDKVRISPCRSLEMVMDS